MSAARPRLLSTSTVWRCAAACSCGLIFKLVLQPACLLMVSTLTTMPLLSRSLLPGTPGAADATASTLGATSPALTADRIGMICARWRMRLSVMSSHLFASLADVRGEVGGHCTQRLAPRRPVIAAPPAQIEVAVLTADISIMGVELRVGAL